MIRRRHAIAGLALVFAASFGAGMALPRDDAPTETGAPARPLTASGRTAPVDALASPPRLPDLRRAAASPKKPPTGTSPPPSAEPTPPAIPPAQAPPPQPPPPPPPATVDPEPPEE